MKRYLFLLALLLACLMLEGRSQGFDLSGLQPPAPYGIFSTLSANSPPQGKAAAALSVERSGGPEFWRFSTNVAYGLTDNMELSATIPYDEDNHSGFEDIALGFKHRFFDEGRYGPSIAYIITGSIASGARGLTTDGRLGAGVALSKRVGPVNGLVNLFYSVPFKSGLEDEVRFSGGIDFSAAHDFRILAELYGRKSHFSDGIDQLEARFGYRFLTGKDIFTTIGMGFGLKDREPRYRFIVSVSAIFPRLAEKIKKVYE
jgi:hypothetical protein